MFMGVLLILLIILLICLVVFKNPGVRVFVCVAVFVCALVLIGRAQLEFIGTPADETKLVLNSVYEVVQIYSPDHLKDYAIVLCPDGSLIFLKTKKTLTVGFYKFEIVVYYHDNETNTDRTRGELVPFSTSTGKSEKG